ncbi:S9 family peptidase [Algibacter sp. L4_22]|uniref:alpha/beta hydrolase family protein n=1 Tax=Algibacter sp. L4_22 TaxID=2942477 RepID=UPI00201B7303|nr:prolyl oligopeptidase family serine peptidase [Algibacter sp. L4_22]MCL5129584.1 prolyl oligopeptidase family serine peptidase [Algibacter sp. L4_22]
MLDVKKIVYNCFIILISICAVSPVYSQDKGPWNLEQLFKVPSFEKTEKASQDGVSGILYESLPVNNNRVQVFAYYSTPKGKVPEGGWPAVVCIHGGGGTAFYEWVKKWNKNGYAAISMDLEGHYPIREVEADKKSPRISTENPGPIRVGTFEDFDKPIKQQWYYNAVAQVILAHSLIRSFPEVNADKVGITGISWGGILTSTVMGIDDRFKFAIPVYGCGFLPGSDGKQGKRIKPGKHTEVVNTYYDGSAYFSNVKIPVFWVNGINDPHFPLPSTKQSLQAVKGDVTIKYQLGMVHGHKPGWEPKEIYAFANSILKNGIPLIKIEKPKSKGNKASVSFRSEKEVKKVEFIYTKDSGEWSKRKWKKSQANISGSKINAQIPEGAICAFFAAIDEDNLMVSSDYMQF